CSSDLKRISRRSLLAGSAGLTLGSMALAGVAPGMAPGVAHADHEPVTGPHAHRGHLAGSGSQRAYSVPPRLEDDVAHDPTAIPGPLPRREPQTVQVYLETEEKEALLDSNATFRFWTFNGTVPGPFVRVRQGDTVE